ncbi:cupin domain-containing protein [Methanobrevibacter curvatus]|uniref:Cupin domain protein n=1 Tax=Methanobrevibacter curvatus TaxID=49547 RepID=A0A166D7K0_9EURY|nr:cupin domain-containing protein [Methanobrevibacter curvatus]KZX15289.1 cupin domain protein [Methanobrevibacter curvatus]
MENLKSKIINIGDFVEYQEGSIVSRELVKKNAGNITIFAFEKGESLSTHSAPFDAIVQIIDGKAEITIDNLKHYLKEGELIIMPANIPHGLLAIERFKMILTLIKSEK